MYQGKRNRVSGTDLKIFLLFDNIKYKMVLLCCIIIATPLVWLAINQTIFLVKLDKFQTMLEEHQEKEEDLEPIFM